MQNDLLATHHFLRQDFSFKPKSLFRKAGQNIFFMVVFLILISFFQLNYFLFSPLEIFPFFPNPTNITFGWVLSSTYYPHYASHEIPEKKGSDRAIPLNRYAHTHLYRLVGWSYCP